MAEQKVSRETRPPRTAFLEKAIADFDRLQKGGEGGVLQHHQSTKPEDDEGKPSFMKAKYGDSIAKAEQKMVDLRKSKR